MTTYADLKSRISDELDRSDINSQIASEVLRSIKHYQQDRFWFNETLYTFPTVASQSNYDVPADLLVIDHLEVTVGTNRYEVDQISWTDYVDKWRFVTSTGQPIEWAYYADDIWLGPTPNDAYTLTLHYVKKLTALSADADENSWTNEAEDLIVCRTKRMLGTHLLGFAQSQLVVLLGAEREAYRALCGRNEQKVMTGKARPWY